ncbi:potassium channel protein [Halarcobacter ebronensis]|uniref:Potassium channel protein n=1 Tax=Halarcobacter ebronensis TaxID=1462615 RepID=A0A4V1LRS0_9BACT|nr:potassium channel protein [Halarcobacter ebronensis]RXJ69168.1 potassium channel protein [Halarcobacter ebronensis]
MSIFKKIKKALGWEFRTAKPEYDLNPLIYSQLKPFRLPLVLVQVVMIIGTMGYILIDDFPILDAIYQTGITFTTVGFGEVAPISPAGRFFTITLIIFGFALFTLSTAILIEAVIKGNLFELYKERNMLYKIARLRKHFVLFYHNEYTAQLARQFNQNHVPFVVVDPSDDIEEIAKECNYPYYVKEEPYKEKAFLKSHLSSAKGAISLSKNISNNITLIASVRLYEKELGRSPFLIISNAETQNEKLRLMKLGADKVVATPSLMAKRVSAMAIRPDMENVLEEFLYKPDTPIDMEEAFVHEESWAVNKEIKDLQLRDKFKVSIIGITEKKGRFIQMPKGNVLITPGCKLLLVGNQRGITRAKRIVSLRNKPKDL